MLWTLSVTERSVCKNREDGEVPERYFEERREDVRTVSTCVEHSFLKIEPELLPDLRMNLETRHAEILLRFQDLRIKYMHSLALWEHV